MKMKVLIVTRSNDNQSVDGVIAAVRERGGEAFRLDTNRFPTDVRLTAGYGGAERLTLACEDWELELDSSLVGVWHRRLAVAEDLPSSMDGQLRQASVQESLLTLMGMLASLDTFVMDPLGRLRVAKNKQLQLRVAKKLGLDVPRTLITNEQRAARDFAQACDGKIVTKMLSSFAIFEGGEERVVFTSPVRAEDLDDLDGLRLCPMTFQEHIPKQVELRTTIVGKRVFTAAIDSQALDRAKDDWRREGVKLAEEWRPYDLPPEVETKLLKLLNVFGLNYGAIDLILTPDDRFVFLEVNPVGEFFWLEQHPGFPISETIAEVLLGRDVRREYTSPQGLELG